MTEEQQQIIWSAYIGICVLKSMTRAARLNLANARAEELLIEMEKAFPFVAERAAKGIVVAKVI